MEYPGNLTVNEIQYIDRGYTKTRMISKKVPEEY